MSLKEIAILEALQKKRRQRVGQLVSLRCKDFPKQNDYLDDLESRFKALNCTRRAGKSRGEVISHIECAMRFPGSRQLYGGITLDSVTEIAWDVFAEVLEERNIPHKKNASKRIIFFENGSRVRLFGIDSSEKQMRKLLGQKLRKVSIDEAGSITVDMKRVCYQMIRPALIDLAPNSWLTLLGTCENIPNTFFERVTEGTEPGWKVHKWTAYDNPFMRKQWIAEIEDIKKTNPKSLESSWFRTHYLNEWCTDDDLLIIPEDKLVRLRKLPQAKHCYVLGVDLGYNDATAFSVIAYSELTGLAWIVHTYKSSGMDFTATAQYIKKLNNEYEFDKIIVDGSNKQGVEEMRVRHKIPLQNAEKTGKNTYLRLLRDEVIEGKLGCIDGTANALITEWKSLVWKNEEKEEEDPRCQNHLSDATLYAWRECLHYTYDPEDGKTEDPHSEEHIDKLQDEEAEKIDNEEGEEWWQQKAA